MTETDWLLLRELAANPHDRRLVEWSLWQRQLELNTLRARGQWSGKRDSQSLDEALIQRLCSEEREQAFLTRVHHELREVISRGEKDTAFRARILRMKGPDRLVAFIARHICTSQFATDLYHMTSEAAPAPSGSILNTDDTAGFREAYDDVGRRYHPFMDSKELAEPGLPHSDTPQVEQFTKEEIHLCLKELQEQDDSSGLELKDFIAELERMVEQA
jgi:hypothetical protein